jgi:hypothetical protein
MPEHAPEPTQPTQPKGRDKDGKPYEPVEIPVPKRKDWEAVLRRATGRDDAKGAPSAPKKD